MIEEQESVDTIKRDRKEYNKQYYIKNRNKQLEKVHKYYSQNSEQIKAYKKEFYQKNRSKILEKAKLDYQNRDKTKDKTKKIIIEF